MSEITTHVLDLSRGVPAGGIEVTLERSEGAGFVSAGRATTDADGRVRSFGNATAPPGRYRLTFRVEPYFAAQQLTCFFPEIHLLVDAREAAGRYHVPLLLSPYGYSTYRGS